jgi:hypothetical protein
VLDERLELRPNVAISETADNFSIRYAHWELKLPSAAVSASGSLRELTGDRSVAQPVDHDARGVVALLAAQGCFIPALPQDLSPADVLTLFQPLRSEMYATYYAHPLWGALREGRASVGQVAAWALHNYHISRSAGVIAARKASQSTSDFLRRSFRADALEEFWHCDAFYFVEGGRLPIDPAIAKTYVPLPAIRAFEDVALRAAETDGLAHLLIAYFQESSIAFGEESLRFYDEVEDRYGLPGFFKGWRRHLTLDREHDHAGGLAALFGDNETVSRATIERSLRSVQLAHHYLTAALDQLMGSPETVSGAISQRQPAAIVNAFHAKSFAPLPGPWWPYFRRKMEEAAFTALSRGRDHDEVMAAGNLAAALQALDDDDREMAAPENPWLAAAGSFLVEQAQDLRTLLALARDLTSNGFCDRFVTRSRLRLAASAAGPVENDRASVVVARFQMSEFLELALGAASLDPLIIGRGSTE